MTTDLIDPTVLALKSDAELRDFLSALRQKECDERVNVNFALYRSQRAIAETRLSNIQNKIRQVEAEFDRRRCTMLPAPTLSTRVVQQFSKPCYSARFEAPRRLYSTMPPDVCLLDPFTYVKPRSPKKLLLKPCTGKPETVLAGTHSNPPKNPDGGGADQAKESLTTSEQHCYSTENCACCYRTTSEESISEDKKKLQPRIIEIDGTTVSNVEESEYQASSLIKSNVCLRIDTERYEENAQKYRERNEIPCSAQCWTAKAYINVADDESMKTLTESESDTVTLSEKINVENICEAQNAIKIQSCEQTINQQEFTSSSDVQQFKKQTEDKIMYAKRNKIIEIRDEIKSLRDILSQEANQEKERVTTAVTNEEPISSVQETESKSLGICASLLKIILKSKKGKRENKQEDKTDEILPSTADAVIEQSTNQVPMSKAKKKIKFHIVSLMTNIEYDKNLIEYEKKQKIEKEIAMNEKEINVTIDPDIEKLSNLHTHRSIENLLKSAIAHNITAGRDHSENIFSKKMDFPKLCFDHQCQATFKEDKTTTAPLLKANIFPPFKNLHKHVTGNWFLYVTIILYI